MTLMETVMEVRPKDHGASIVARVDTLHMNDCLHCNRNLDQRISPKEAKKCLDKDRGKR